MFSFIEENFPESTLGNMGEQKERGLVLTALHLPALDRGHRDSGQPEIASAGGGSGGCYTQGWAGPGMQLGRAI